MTPTLPRTPALDKFQWHQRKKHEKKNRAKKEAWEKKSGLRTEKKKEGDFFFSIKNPQAGLEGRFRALLNRPYKSQNPLIFTAPRLINGSENQDFMRKFNHEGVIFTDPWLKKVFH